MADATDRQEPVDGGPSAQASHLRADGSGTRVCGSLRPFGPRRHAPVGHTSIIPLTAAAFGVSGLDLTDATSRRFPVIRPVGLTMPVAAHGFYQTRGGSHQRCDAAATLVAFPVAAGIIGGVVAVLRAPRQAVVSGVQHFAAGVVMAAVAGEVLPQLRERGPLWLIVIGFAAGVAVLVGMRRFEGGDTVESGLPVGLLVVAMDLFIDGLLVGTGAAVSTETATIIAIALTVEVLFLSLSVALRLTSSGASSFVAAALTALLSLAVALGAILGALVLGDAGPAVVSFVLAFAAAALLWLVVEELLVEAHETPDRPWMTAMFFVGFLALFCLEAIA